MGEDFTDQYSLLHFAVGIMFRFWNIPLLLALSAHLLFEYVENTDAGRNFINKYLTLWPGGKPKADTILNSIGDTFWFAMGWILADKVMKA